MSLATTYRNHADSWITPPEWWAWVIETLGGDNRDSIFDPCPADWPGSGVASGLDIEWESPCYVNFPGTKKRGVAQRWWTKYIAEQERHRGRLRFVWCAFNVEQLRLLRPSPFHLPGWLVLPRERTSFLWGGGSKDGRKHGERATSPGNWAVWWSTEEPAMPPGEAIIVRTC